METFVGALFGIVIGFGITVSVFDSELSAGIKTVEKIEACQKDLPRNEHCGVVAIPLTDIEQED